jgi:hypothetical protein
MDYASTVPFDGNTAKAFDLASTALTSLGFRIVTRDDASLDLAGPGMNSTRQSPLLGASRIRVTRGPRELALGADLGGVQWMTRFATFFPVGLSLCLGVGFLVLFGLLFGPGAWILVVGPVTGVNALLWLVLGPVLGRRLRARTCQGIDALLNNMAVAGKTD